MIVHTKFCGFQPRVEIARSEQIGPQSTDGNIVLVSSTTSVFNGLSKYFAYVVINISLAYNIVVFIRNIG